MKKTTRTGRLQAVSAIEDYEPAFRMGQVVQLKSGGGVRFTVCPEPLQEPSLRNFKDKAVWIVWTDADDIVRVATIPECALELASPEAP